MWPGVFEGYRRRLPGFPADRPVILKTLTLTPLLFEVEGSFLSDWECDDIQALAKPHMTDSAVSLMDHDKGKEATEWRTSQTYFLQRKNNPMLEKIDERVSNLLKISIEYQEEAQILRYGTTQYYAGHHDFFDPYFYQNDERTQALTDGGLKNRIATVFWYLSDVSEGGETIFLRARGSRSSKSHYDCSDTAGLKVKPKKGKVIFWYNLKFDGQLDHDSLHGGCPVEGKDVKWSANKWIWNSPQNLR
jgi:prolyl 4-hydroxylase